MKKKIVFIVVLVIIMGLVLSACNAESIADKILDGLQRTKDQTESEKEDTPAPSGYQGDIKDLTKEEFEAAFNYENNFKNFSMKVVYGYSDYDDAGRGVSRNSQYYIFHETEYMMEQSLQKLTRFWKTIKCIAI